MKITNELMQEVALYVNHYMQVNNNPALFYHNEKHTHHVVEACNIIGSNSGLNKQEQMTLHLAAWFHDIGYLTKPDGHEALGATMAAVYFRGKGLNEDIISQIEKCILATHMPQQPHGLLEQVICDADLQYLGSGDFEYISGMLRKEFAAEKGKVFTDEEWIRFNLDFLGNHGFYTSFARQTYNEQKRKNIHILEQKLGALTASVK